jgi:8-hydroxy-5-deazaflavin:NADPH oxidoreductase
MKIAVLGAGNVGATLGNKLFKAGHDIRYGVPDPHEPKYKKLNAQTVKEAVRGAEVILLATPWSAAQEALKESGDVSGKTIVDCTNPLKSDLSGLVIGQTDSAAEQIARWLPKAKVCKAFNQTGADNMADPVLEGRRSVMFVCGDDAQAKKVVLSLVDAVGFEAVDAGPLMVARLLESLAMLWIHLAIKGGLGRGFAFGLLRR